MIASPACSCGAAEETPLHLLQCPHYLDAAETFLKSPSINGDNTLLLGEVHTLLRSRRIAALAAGEAFLAHVAQTRPGLL